MIDAGPDLTGPWVAVIRPGRSQGGAGSNRFLFSQRDPRTFLAPNSNPSQKGSRCRANFGHSARQCFLPLLLSILTFRRPSFLPPPDICPQHVRRDAIDDE
jgi:hypothetical protein